MIERLLSDVGTALTFIAAAERLSTRDLTASRVRVARPGLAAYPDRNAEAGSARRVTVPARAVVALELRIA
jgi:hypothetical protein